MSEGASRDPRASRSPPRDADARPARLAPEPFLWHTRVYYEDTDAGNVVYYANYLRYLERARTEWLRARGHGQREIAQRLGLLFVVVRVEIDYRLAARLDDALVVTCDAQPRGRVSMNFRQRVHRDTLEGPLLADALVQAACVDAHSLRPRRLPEFVL